MDVYVHLAKYDRLWNATLIRRDITRIYARIFFNYLQDFFLYESRMNISSKSSILPMNDRATRFSNLCFSNYVCVRMRIIFCILFSNNVSLIVTLAQN